MNGVNIRPSATTDSTRISILLPGESAARVRGLPNWYHIEHPELGTRLGSKSRIRVVTSGAIFRT